MNQKLKILEAIFEREIANTLPYQSKSKLLAALHTEGLIEPMVLTLPGRFVVTVKGWQLTQLGRITYCESCASKV